jgi:acetyl/propionyl-CoA carboxylase alpha subunit
VIFEASVDGRTLRVEVSGKDGRYTVVLDGRPLQVDMQETGRDFVSLLIDGRSYEVGLEKRPGGYNVVLPDDSLDVELADATHGNGAVPRRAPSGPARVTAPMPGKIVRLLVGAGDAVITGQGLVVIEAMKMENELRSPRDGHVRELPASEGQAVETGALLAVVE